MESPIIQLEKMAFGRARGKNDVWKAGEEVPVGTRDTIGNNQMSNAINMVKQSPVTMAAESV